MANEQLPSGWAFSRCITCLGFALVRPGAKNIIKVDTAPAGENVLLPNSYTVSGRTEITSQLQADGSVAAVSSASPAALKPIIKPAKRRPSIPQTREAYTREAAHFAQMAAITEAQADLRAASAAAMNEIAQSLTPSLSGKRVPFPMPLPESPPRAQRAQLMPVVIGLAAAVIVASAFLHFT